MPHVGKYLTDRGHQVRVIAFSPQAGFDFWGRGRRGGGRPGSNTTARVAADGSYRLEALAPGPYVVRAILGDMRDLPWEGSYDGARLGTATGTS